MKTEFKFALGEKVKDIVTGYSGVIMGASVFLTGCNQYGVLPQKLSKDGDVTDWRWFDENRLIKVGKGVELPKQEKPIRGFDGNHCLKRT